VTCRVQVNVVSSTGPKTAIPMPRESKVGARKGNSPTCGLRRIRSEVARALYAIKKVGVQTRSRSIVTCVPYRISTNSRVKSKSKYTRRSYIKYRIDSNSRTTGQSIPKQSKIIGRVGAKVANRPTICTCR